MCPLTRNVNGKPVVLLPIGTYFLSKLSMFAIVDVETTGGSTEGNNITEIAIVLHNGKEMEGKFTSLVNPCKPIQKFVQTLTGITDDMVAQAPVFKEIAPNIFNLLKDRVFVAHNVNFDYSLVKQQLAEEGFDLRSDKLCTIRLSEVVFPNLTKYGLGTVCKELNIPFSKRHRAEGDALATTLLLEKLFEHDKAGIIAKHLKRKAYQYLPQLGHCQTGRIAQRSGRILFPRKGR